MMRLTRVWRLMFLCLPTWLAVPAASLAQRLARTGSVYADSCLPASEFELRGIALHGDATSALEQLGHPIRVSTDSGEDDAGSYERRTYYYRDVEIRLVRDQLDRLATHSLRTATPSGLRPGLTRDDVRRLLASKGVTFKQGKDTLEIPTCPVSEDVGYDDLMKLTFTSRGQVRELWMESSRP